MTYMQATSADISLAQLDGPLAQSASFEELKIREKKKEYNTVVSPLHLLYMFSNCYYDLLLAA